ncbi:hypothetical protein BD408DRAFT_95184 [Parasitella parasitica]|nr:hypothetical protein BD408DRAFT_95184 [Parasitella parasitica]
MKINPKSLKPEFKIPFEAQPSIEKAKDINAKKRKYEHLKLESKYNTIALSEIFQDRDLLARIPEESYSLMNTRGVRPSRVRDPSDIITFRKPQAKDVTSARVVEQEVTTM